MVLEFLLFEKGQGKRPDEQQDSEAVEAAPSAESSLYNGTGVNPVIRRLGRASTPPPSNRVAPRRLGSMVDFPTIFANAAMAEVAYNKLVLRTIGKNHQAQGFRQVCDAACPDNKKVRQEICEALAKQGMIEFGLQKILAGRLDPNDEDDMELRVSITEGIGILVKQCPASAARVFMPDSFPSFYTLVDCMTSIKADVKEVAVALQTLSNAVDAFGSGAHAILFAKQDVWSLLGRIVAIMPLQNRDCAQFNRPGATPYQLKRAGVVAVECLASLLACPPGQERVPELRGQGDCFCMEPFLPDSELWVCAVCLKPLHHECAKRWHARSGGLCPFCRSPDPAVGLAEVPEVVERLLHVLETHHVARSEPLFALRLQLLIVHAAAAERNKHRKSFDAEWSEGKLLRRLRAGGCFALLLSALEAVFESDPWQGYDPIEVPAVWRFAVCVGQLATLPGTGEDNDLYDLLRPLARAIVRSADTLKTEEMRWCHNSLRRLQGLHPSLKKKLHDALRDPDSFTYGEVVEAEALLESLQSETPV
eukprot:gnl/MRDRNA2_/MRDRNA2_170607_c0_seq1.p1 gnl/MRDRNA2_/MRDRNA2_170607_c0~~gnl/MRDRNA2_/MRDRNA2_170607_c0_seq1.p1  ORF type:complete len:535 (+),score=78.93 gnl/MRDRNA2_/MRDRNA2_170607_c0_seq1:94-1698(+)